MQHEHIVGYMAWTCMWEKQFIFWCDRSWEYHCCKSYQPTFGQLKRKWEVIIRELPKAVGDENRSFLDKNSIVQAKWLKSWGDWFSAIRLKIDNQCDGWQRFIFSDCRPLLLFISTDLFEFLKSEIPRSRDLLNHDANKHLGVILLTTLRKCAHEYQCLK